jgi:Fur family zinc uptake transcriptional regulator
MCAAEAICTRDGARLTPLRRRVLELVWASHRPILAYELLDRLREERASAAPPTVYRALDFLMRHGLVHRIESMNAFVGCSMPEHPHDGQFLICDDCNTVSEMDHGDIDALIRRHARRSGYLPQRQTVEIHGRCQRCQRFSAR